MEFSGNISDADWDAIEELRQSGYGEQPKHQVGGYPDPVQGDEMEQECQLASNGIYCGDASASADPRTAELLAKAADWTLLLQIDTDDDIDMMWGDCGTLYFWIRRDDLRRANFDDVWMVLQCC